jgi:hypothetical protein
MRKRVFVCGVAIVAVALAFVLTDSLLMTLGAGVTEASICRIRPGMTRPQVERLLGEPGEYEPFTAPDGRPDTRGVWSKNQIEVEVWFDPYGRVYQASYSLGPDWGWLYVFEPCIPEPRLDWPLSRGLADTAAKP